MDLRPVFARSSSFSPERYAVSAQTELAKLPSCNRAPLKTLGSHRLVRQTDFCDPQIPWYSEVLETGFPASQL